MAVVAVSPELWSEFDDALESLIDGNQTADKSYTVGKGMSLASIAVGSVAMRLTKVRAMAQNRDLKGTKTALDKATVKIREAAFTSSGDPEGITLGENLEILASLTSVLDRMENPVRGGGAKSESRDNAKTRAAAAVAKPQRRDKGGDEVETPEEAVQAGAADKRAIGGVFRDLGIIEPDDDPLSCLADEEDSAGGGRPKMRFLVAPVDPELAAMDFAAASTSLIGEGRRHARVLQEALLHWQDSPGGSPAVDAPRPVLSPVSTTTETVTKSPSFFRGGKREGKHEETASPRGADKPAEPTGKTVPPADDPPPERTPRVIFCPLEKASEGEQETPGVDLEATDTLRKQLRQASNDGYWPRLTLAYGLEEQGEHWADAGNLSASCSAYSEASELFRICSDQLPSEPESLLRQWVTARRAREVGYTAVPPDMGVLRRCIKICTGNTGSLSEGISSNRRGHGSCKNPVCYEAHLELAGVLLERGQFERCIQTCRHVLDEHDENDAEALFSLAQALEALGLSEEARQCASRASSLLAAATR